MRVALHRHFNMFGHSYFSLKNKKKPPNGDFDNSVFIYDGSL